MYVRNSDNAWTNPAYRVYVPSKDSIALSRSSILPSALSTCPCHSDHFRRSILSRIASPNPASHCTSPLPYCSHTVSLMAKGSQSKRCVAIGLISNWSFRSVSSPSARNVISWFICKPCDCNTSYRRRLGLVSSVCTNPRPLCDGDLVSSSSPKLSTLLPTMTSKLCYLSHQWRTYPPSMPTVKAPSGCGKRTQLLGLPSIKQGCSSPNSASSRLATLSVSYRTVLTSRVRASGRKSWRASRLSP